MDAAVHMIVEGRVQGVGFRWFVSRKAAELGLRGFARNNEDGTVEIEAEGDRELLGQLLAETWIGPRGARVAHIHVQWKPTGRRFTSFEIVR